MQRIVIRIQGVEIPLMVRHEANGLMECETVTQVELGDGIVVYPGALMRVPVGGVDRGPSQKAWAIYNGPVKPQ